MIIHRKRGFTLIELSIVLVIIGLIVGGVLVGRDLVSAAEVRAQVTQIEKYNAAVNTFHSKFDAIPGDMPIATAQQFGFTVGANCGGTAGRRDGNGLIDGCHGVGDTAQLCGETGLFWQDLSSSAAGSLIDTVIPNSGAPAATCGGLGSALVVTQLPEYFPLAKIGKGNLLYVYDYSGINWLGLSALTSFNSTIYSNANISVSQAYKIDIKVDDGLPTTGNVQAAYINNLYGAAPNTTTSGGTSASCYDTTTGTYSITFNNGSGGNCALSFKIQ